MYYLGVDIGGTTIKAGIVDDAGQVTARKEISTIADDCHQLIASLKALILELQTASEVRAVGIGVPGFTNKRTRRVLFSPNIPCLTDISLEKAVADEVHIQVVSENDANAAAYGEFTAGSAIGLEHMAYLTVGTGLGAGLILNGELFSGTSGYAMELGHTVVQPEGRPCGCGRVGCLETIVSAHGIVMTAFEMMHNNPQSRLHEVPQPLTSAAVFDAAIAGDSAAVSVFQRTGRWLGLACANLINLLNLQMIALGGGVMAAGELLLKPAVAEAQRHAIAPSFQDCRIVQSRLGADAGIIGAAMLARDRRS